MNKKFEENLNTSHVKVNLGNTVAQKPQMAYLNTSHVKVNLYLIQ